jgi:hypothetical protein
MNSDFRRTTSGKQQLRMILGYNNQTSSSVTAPSSPRERPVEVELKIFLSAARQSACCAVSRPDMSYLARTTKRLASGSGGASIVRKKPLKQ